MTDARPMLMPLMVLPNTMPAHDSSHMGRGVVPHGVHVGRSVVPHGAECGAECCAGWGGVLCGGGRGVLRRGAECCATWSAVNNVGHLLLLTPWASLDIPFWAGACTLVLLCRLICCGENRSAVKASTCNIYSHSYCYCYMVQAGAMQNT
jgi:hypothetical protein